MSRLIRYLGYLTSCGRILLLLLLFHLSITSLCQQKCGTTNYITLKQGNGHIENQQKFEEWLEQKIETQKGTPSVGRTAADSYAIQVVVHVVPHASQIEPQHIRHRALALALCLILHRNRKDRVRIVGQELLAPLPHERKLIDHALP